MARMYDIPDYPWQVMTMDEKSGLPLTVNGNDSLWVFLDKLSKRAHFTATKHKVTSPQIARIFMDVVFKHHGIPEVIISDRDSLFTASFWDDLWKMIGTNLNMASTNNPGTDGQSERTIKTLIEMVSNFAESNPKRWDEFLPALEFAYNDSVQASTGFSAFEIDMGRSPMTPIKMLAFGLLSHRRYYTADDGGVNPKEFLENLSKNIAIARKNLYKAQWTRKQASTKGTVSVHYKPGDQDYMEHPDLYTPKHTSMDPNYMGPYKVVREVAEGVYELDLPFALRFRHPVINGRKLKLFQDRRRVHFADAVPTPPVETSTIPTVPIVNDISGEVEPSGFTEVNQRHRIRAASNVEVLELTVRKKPNENDRVSDAMVRLTDQKVGKAGWCSVHRAISEFKHWYIIHDYIQNNQQKLQRPDHIFELVSKVFGKTRFQGYVTEYDPADEFPYAVTYQDGDREDYTEAEFQALVTHTLAYCDAVQHDQSGNVISNSYWVFPRRLAKLYAKLTRPYTLDAFGHRLGHSSKAPRFCSNVNPVFKYDLTGMGVWGHPDSNVIGAFLKYFLKCYRRNPTKTSLMVTVPFWVTKRWWALLHQFRLIDLIPTGTELFTSPLLSASESEVMTSKGPTRWHTLVLYLGAEYHPERLWKVTQSQFSKSSTTEYQRLYKIKTRNLMMTGDTVIDSDAIYHLLDQIKK